ncbi:MAG: PAS domain-containing sensor histidine kinase, partial [Gaiellaceae bacterium]
DSAIAIADLPGAATALDAFTTVGGLALITVVVTILVRRWRSASSALRRLFRPVIGAGIATLLAIALVVIAEQVSSTVADALQLLFFAAFSAVPIAFLLGILQSRLARSSVSDVVVALQAGVPLRDALATALGDPTLEVVYRLDIGRWVDPSGRPVPDPAESAGRNVTTVTRDGQPVAALVHDASLSEEPELIDAVTAAAGLSLHNERLQAELRAQYTFLETITNTVPSLLVNVDTEGRLLNHNQAAVSAAGYGDEEDIRGRHFWDVFIDESEREAMRARFAAAAPDFAAAEYENTFTNARGEQVAIYWRNAPVVDEQGNVASIVSGGLDVTERTRREEEIRAAEERFRAVIESAPLAIAEIGLDEAVNLWNPAAERIFGWSPDEVLGHPPRWVPEDLREEFRALSAREALGDGYTGFETVRVHRDGRRLEVEISAAPIRDAAGSVVGAMAVLSDISDRKRQEQELRASRARLVAAADEARQALERNLHDGAQQRLVALSVALRLVESRLRADPEAASTLLGGAREELAQALEELRELARGIHPAVLTDRGLRPALEALVGRAGLPVKLEAPRERLTPAVEAAAYYVVAEALTNVAKYAEASSAAVRVAQNNGVLAVVVTDDGVGGADPSGGTGLRGLADRVAALDGSLIVESPIGQGTSVRATIPLAEASPEE